VGARVSVITRARKPYLVMLSNYIGVWIWENNALFLKRTIMP